LATTAKNVDDETLMRKRTSYPRQQQQHVSMTRSSRASARGIHIASGDGDDNNNGNDDDECRRQGLGRECPAFSYRVAQRRRRQQQLLATTND
jgi:hypothetical protein